MWDLFLPQFKCEMNGKGGGWGRVSGDDFNSTDA